MNVNSHSTQETSIDNNIHYPIFTTESLAIYKVIEHLNNITGNLQTNYIILSDSLSRLNATNNVQNPTDVTKLIQTF